MYTNIMTLPPLIIRSLDITDYLASWNAMKHFTENSDENTPDEIWLLEHFPVFTQGLAGKAEHILDPHSIPIIQTDRGGQVTYHGPGQLMVYLLFDLNRLSLNTRTFVRHIEQTIVDYLKEIGAVASSSEAKRLIESHAITVDGLVIEDFKATIKIESGMTIKVGKHRIYRVE